MVRVAASLCAMQGGVVEVSTSEPRLRLRKVDLMRCASAGCKLAAVDTFVIDKPYSSTTVALF